jgi:signal peptidase I
MEGTIMTGEFFTVTRSDEFKKNDIVVFDIYSEDYAASQDQETGKFPLHWEKRVYRLIAMSGDTLVIKEGEVFINSKHVVAPPRSKRKYTIRSMKPLDIIREDDYSSFVTKDDDIYVYKLLLSEEEVNQYKAQYSAILSVEKYLTPYEILDTFTVRPFVSCQWTVDDFGPLAIPSPGQTVIIDEFNYKLYQHVPGIQMGKNIIKEKLYFLMGDNRHAAMDSRYIGFISQSKMYGVVK